MLTPIRTSLRPCLGWLLALTLPWGASAADPASVPPSDPSLARLLEPIRQRYDLPALAALVLTSQGISASAVVGVRQRGTEIPVTLADQWHLGSETKAMTAALAARLVERGQLRWESTLGEVFPEFATNAQPALAAVTLRHLLAHRAGLPANLNLADYPGTNAPAERLRAVRETLARPPLHPPGSNFLYSNLGYILAGAMIERVTGQSWEAAMQAEIFAPLGMTHAGFGGLGTPGQVDQPWPHRSRGEAGPTNGPTADNPPVLGPAGRVHAPLADWARFIQDQLRGAAGQPALLQPASYRALRTPSFGGDYALGWLVLERDWGGGQVLHHTGDNTENHANTWLAPRRDFAVLVCTNQGGDRAREACDATVAALIQWQAQRTPAGPVGAPERK